MSHPGTIIADRYQLERELGRGAMGSVWLARHMTLGTYVALKLIHLEAARNAQSLARFEREAVIVAHLNSPYIVHVSDYGYHNDLPYIAMEYLEGQSLRQHIDARSRLLPKQTAVVVEHVADALTAAHEAGLVHRDIKPENVFVSRDAAGREIYKVLDFGIAKVTDELARDSVDPTQTGALIGTPYYLSPEQARGLKSLDYRADLWSLGVLAYECVTGVRPFTGPGMGPLIAKIIAQDAPPPSTHVPELPRDIDEFFWRALQRDPAQRFRSAREMSEAFSFAAGVADRAPSDEATLVAAAHAVAGATVQLGTQNDEIPQVVVGTHGHDQPPNAYGPTQEYAPLDSTVALDSDARARAQTVAFPEGFDAMSGGAAMPVPPVPSMPNPGDLSQHAAAHAPQEDPNRRPQSHESLLAAPWPEAPVEVPKKSNAGFLVVAAIVIVGLIGGGAAFYITRSDDSQAETEEVEADKPKPKPAAADSAEPSEPDEPDPDEPDPDEPDPNEPDPDEDEQLTKTEPTSPTSPPKPAPGPVPTSESKAPPTTTPKPKPTSWTHRKEL